MTVTNFDLVMAKVSYIAVKRAKQDSIPFHPN